MSKRNIGSYGERVAESYLREEGYSILERNWYCQGGEIDLVCYKNRLVFVEVKFVNGTWCSPYDQITYSKLKKVMRSIRKYIELYPKYIGNWRLDLIAIQRIDGKNNISHHKSLNLMD
jgi:putative endonuclease